MAGRSAARRDKLELDRRSTARDAGEDEITFDSGFAVFERETGDNQLAGVGIVDADDGLGSGGGHEAFIDSEGSDGGRHVAAVAAVIDEGFTDGDLGKGVIDVGLRMR